MTTLIFTHPDFRLHDTGMGHPESPARIDAVWDVLGSGDFRQLEQREAPEATVEQLAAVHVRAYVDAVLAAVPSHGRVHLDPDTVLSATSRSAILRASGAVCAAVDGGLGEGVDNAFCAVRPWGHQGTPAGAVFSGFCTTIAGGAELARRKHGVKKVAIVDFDVHHGNGTQAMVEDEPDLFFASTHEWPFYPGTGAREERGNHDNVVNVPLAAFAGSAEFRRGMKDFILPAVEAFAPDLLMISAGFDAHRRDPLAHINLEAEDFAWATRELMAVARRHCDGKIVSVLEGGYSMDGLAESLAAHLRELMAA